ncbi:carbohydrate ABC transporter membrane protein 2, CUT1 family [Candidatus Vecturithrix granuli]|uniref:Carbohydrate ABC transporter membrane protein 2, CUT1 family n=1 Tax=Vecturithrix granuli TaxID=1499967 RepID=A0A081BZ07_VECG1|nr:carbohydrate ABC transporter membrane protein 2, CUT1 family [Candidatus Vecturithrix granuli]
MKKVFWKISVWGFLLVVCFYCLLPFAWMFSTSLKTETEAFRIPPTWIPLQPTIDSYIGIWVRKNFGVYFFNSTAISLATALLSTFVGGMAGYGFSRFVFKGRRFLIGFFLATQMLPGVLLVGPYFKVLTKIGLYDTRTGLIIAFLTICLPFSTWMMKGFIDKVPVELDQSAMIDGCSRIGVFFKILAPVIAPGMVATILFAFLLAWGDLLWALCLTTSESMITVTLGIARTVGEFRIIWPMLMAGSLVGGMPAIILYIFLQRLLVQGLTAGAVKE